MNYDIESILNYLQENYKDYMLATEPCFSEKQGDYCWCKTIIIPNYKNGKCEEVIGYGEISTEEATHIVALHNRKIKIANIIKKI